MTRPANLPAAAAQSVGDLQDVGRSSGPASNGAPGPALDDLTALAARLCEMPMALVNVFDGGRLLVRSRFGIDLDEIELEKSFCREAMTGGRVLVVPDAAADRRFLDNPLVAGMEGIRAYAGIPLVLTDGMTAGGITAGAVTVGTLCVMDTVPRQLSKSVLDDLALLARQVASQLQLLGQADALRSEIAAKTSAEVELTRSRRLLDEVLAHADVLIYAKDLGGRYVLANAASERTMGHGSGDLIGLTDREAFAGTGADSFGRNDAKVAFSGAMQVFEEDLRLPDGAVRRFRSTKFPLVDEAGEVYAIAGVSTDITELVAVRAGMLGSERRFRELFDNSPVAIGLSDERGLWVDVNPALGRLLGVDVADLVGHSALDHAHPDDHAIVADSELGQMTSPDGVMRTEIRFVQPDGTIRWTWVNVTATPGPNDEKWTLGILQDITERKAAENALRRSEGELAAIAAVARCVQAGADPRPVVVASIRALSGASVVRLLEPIDGETLLVTAGDGADAISFAPGSTADLVRRTGRPTVLPLEMVGNPAAGGTALWQPVLVEGEVIAVLNVAWPRVLSGMDDRAVQSVAALVDEAGASLHAMQLRTELERFAATDPLTGALNRRAWEADLVALMERARAASAPLTIALIDLDHFKAFNDANGHAAGDELLRDFAATVRTRLRPVDLFARWGGEEFVAALSDCDAERAVALLDRVRAAVPQGQSCSIGHTIWVPGETMATCIGRADTALYKAKSTGRDRLSQL
jgi:diguanylate cyclase (GGDEF)-like protein/PAS domain S-box-containing protein